MEKLFDKSISENIENSIITKNEFLFLVILREMVLLKIIIND